MKKCKLLFSICAIFITHMAFATTVTYNWLVDGTNYAQTTCEIGNDLILPTPTPTKYGYHFVGWVESTMFGHWEQNGTPTPQNPIEPTFTQFGNTVLRAVGTGNNLIADSYDPQTRKILRRIGVKVLNGTEYWVKYGDGKFTTPLSGSIKQDNQQAPICSHFIGVSANNVPTIDGRVSVFNASIASTSGGLGINHQATQELADFKAFLAQQYANGTPVIVYYPLATPIKEDPQ